MKRVFLRIDGSDQIDVELARQAAVAIATFASGGDAGRSVGDPVHEWVTEGRRQQYEVALARREPWAVALSKVGGYSSCGDLAHTVLFALGCRDERLVNRTADGGTHPWIVGANIARFAASELLTHPHPGTADRPTPGSIGWLEPPDHVCVAESWVESDGVGVFTSLDFGQPYGRRRKRAIGRRGNAVTVDGRELMGWLDIADLVPLLTESAMVPDSFVGGVPDENPYEEADAGYPAG